MQNLDDNFKKLVGDSLAVDNLPLHHNLTHYFKLYDNIVFVNSFTLTSHHVNPVAIDPAPFHKANKRKTLCPQKKKRLTLPTLLDAQYWIAVRPQESAH